MGSQPRTIVVFGGGLAGNMVAMSLASSLSTDCRIIQLAEETDPAEDVLYGNATDPESYNFLLRLGLDEPTLLLNSATSFSYGTHFRQWPASRSWVQCHHAPLPTLSGIPLRHHITRVGEPLEPYLVSAEAAKAGRFAHPPAGPDNPLSLAEYGYQFDVSEWTALLNRKIEDSRIERIRSPIVAIETREGWLTGVRLQNHESIEADFFVDASGVSRRAILAAGGQFDSHRAIGVRTSVRDSSEMGPPCRIIESGGEGWSCTAHLQNADQTLHIGAPPETSDRTSSHRVQLGTLADAWVANCAAVGHAASVTEPLTPGPMIMLRRDIERLVELIPARDMTVERCEFNRRFHEDVEHLAIFHDRILTSDASSAAPYWREAAPEILREKLQRKIRQFENRGVLTNYDLEPFNEDDWTILHMGLRGCPRQYDRQVDGVPEQDSREELGRIRQSIRQLVSSLPTHHVYVTRLKQYLRKKYHG